MAQVTYEYKKGERPHLDEVMEILGLLPQGCYHQDDIGSHNPYISQSQQDNDAGETILFLKNVTIKVNIKVT